MRIEVGEGEVVCDFRIDEDLELFSPVFYREALDLSEPAARLDVYNDALLGT
ncbi:MAG: hypothetical protein H0V77_07680 [Actinobacteria bacterium]|nr:hypothetical protein [Actinomycetota bacterium]